MALTLYGLIEACVLLINALAILNEERFLKPLGWAAPGAGTGMPMEMMMGGAEERSVKDKIVTLLASIRMLLRIPLILVNLVVILLELLFG